MKKVTGILLATLFVFFSACGDVEVTSSEVVQSEKETSSLASEVTTSLYEDLSSTEEVSSETYSEEVSSETSSEEVSSEASSEEPVKMITFNNKLAENGNDPWVIFHSGYYYYCYSGKGGVYVSQSRNLNEIGTSDGTLVWSPDDPQYNSELWAPELHFIDGAWYIYVAADDGNNYNHRMLCLRGTDTSPLEPFESMGVLRAETDRWAIDGTVMQYKNKLYFIWSGWEGTENVAQNIYIAEMDTPWSISSERVLLSSPEYDWEKRGGSPSINEGPTVLELNGTYHIVYSASGSWCDDYCLGLLTLKGDPMDKKGWEKSDVPVFSKTDKIFGPGHASFTVSPDGERHYIAYHANEVSGSGWEGRKLFVQEFTVDENNYPVFGIPHPAGTMQTVPENKGE